MVKTLLASLVAACVLGSMPASAQTLGGLRGYVKDEQGGVLPGVLVTATGPQILAPIVGVTDDSGYYRLLNVPPGNLTLRAELNGFASYLREGIPEIRTGGSEASTPLSLGIYMNIIAPQGGNVFKGGASFAFQPLAWNSDNSLNSRVKGGVPKPEGVRQLDLSLGGPILQNKAWFFTSYRWASDINGISRTPLNLNALRAFRPNFEPFSNTWRSKNPFVKVNTQVNPNHSLSAFYHYDRSYYTSNREFGADPIAYQSGGGSLAQARLNAVWGQHLVSELSVAYSNKGNSSAKTYSKLNLASGPQVAVHNDTFISSGVPVGTGLLVQMNNPQSTPIQPSSLITLQGEVTYFKDGWGGAHEFKSGVWAAPPTLGSRRASAFAWTSSAATTGSWVPSA